MRCTRYARSSHGFAVTQADQLAICARLSGPTQHGLGKCTSELPIGELVGGNTEIIVPVGPLFE